MATNPKMHSPKIKNAIARLEQNLPIRHNQTRLSPALRQLHQAILRYYLEHGKAPGANDLKPVQDWASSIRQLAAEHIIVLSDAGEITGAYPLVNETRNFRVITRHGPVNAMCAFDALAVSSMFSLPTRIESRCQLSNRSIVIEQYDDDISTIEPQEPVFAAINWGAAAGASSCSATLCCEMIFIVGEDKATSWQNEAPDSRELFELNEAHAFISAVFVPLMH